MSRAIPIKPKKTLLGDRNRGGALVEPEDVSLGELRRLKSWIDRSIAWKEFQRGKRATKR